MELCSVLCGSLDGGGVWERMGSYVCDWVTSLLTRNYLSMASQLYSRVK